MKKNIYMVQANFIHGNSTYFPYAVGTLVAAAQAKEEISANYHFGEIFILRENTDAVVNRMDEPYAVGFSNYIWNYEYNKLLAAKVKKAYPDCKIIFGGHHISYQRDFFSQCPDCDYFIFGEGEEVFSDILLSFIGKMDINDVPNIAYRKNGERCYTEKKYMKGIDYPSPYLNGVFDDLLKKYSSMSFYAIIETSRGCPYKCAYCDWGHLDSKKIKLFPLERTFKELEWLCEHNIDALGGADANFGISKRDEQIVDYMVELYRKTGHIKNFQTSYAKNSNETVFNMTRKLNDCGMNKGVTLSFQSLSQDALENVGRKNIPVESYKELLTKYAEAGIATYTELILGLPGETYESFANGLNILLESGQHHAIYVHNCEYLPCAKMSNKMYTEKFGIKTAKIPLNQPHRSAEEHDEAPEFSEIVVETKTMSREDWRKSNILSIMVQCFHNGGLLSMFAIYLHNEMKIQYIDFYEKLREYIGAHKNTLMFSVLNAINTKLVDVESEKGDLTCVDSRFGSILWPFEEYSYLCFLYEFDVFFNEIKDFLLEFDIDSDIFDSLLVFQKNMIKRPFESENKFVCKYDFCSYFRSAFTGKRITLNKKNVRYEVPNVKKYNSFEEFAMYSVWYGRKDIGNIYLQDIIEEIET